MKKIKFDKQRQYPLGFHIIFMSEFVSKFTFWGVQSLLVLYLITQMQLTHVTAYGIFGVFAAMSWGVSIVAGYLADRYFGFKKLILYGFLFALFGNILLLFHTQSLFLLGLAFLVCGTGLVIPNNANMIGALYDEGDARRDKGYGSFYVASNLGALISPILFGYIKEYLGWTLTFIICALAFILWFVLYLKNRVQISDKGNFQGDKVKYILLPFLKLDVVLFIAFILFSILIYFLLKDSNILGYVLAIISFVGLLYLGFTTSRYSSSDKFNVVLLLVMMIFIVLFFACEFQTLNSFIVFMKNYVKLNIFGVPIPVSAFVCTESLFVIVLTFLVVNPLWKYLGARQPSYFMKLSIGTGIGGISFFIFTYTAHLALVTGLKVSIWWMVLGIMLLSLGELFLMPPILAAISKLSPKKIKGTMMGILYFAISISGYLSGEIAKFTSFLSKSDSPIVGFQITYMSLATFMLALSIFTFACVCIPKLFKR